MTVKALFPIGKTQWRKWTDMQRNAFNSLRSQGKDFNAAVALANEMPSVFEQLEDAEPELTPVPKPKPKPAKPRTRKA